MRPVTPVLHRFLLLKARTHRTHYSYVLTTRDLQGGVRTARSSVMFFFFLFFLPDRTLNVLHLTFCEFLACDSCTSEAMNSITVAEETPERNQSKSNVSSIKWLRGGGGSGGGGERILSRYHRNIISATLPPCLPRKTQTHRFIIGLWEKI